MLVEESEGVGEEVADVGEVEEGEGDADEGVDDGEETAPRRLRRQVAVACKHNVG